MRQGGGLLLHPDWFYDGKSAAPDRCAREYCTLFVLPTQALLMQGGRSRGRRPPSSGGDAGRGEVAAPRFCAQISGPLSRKPSIQARGMQRETGLIF
jgi:hypothetical protein